MPFMGQESHVLERWKPSSCIKPCLSMKREGYDNWNILTIPIECLAFYSSRGYVLFLTEKHRWTEHTAFHRGLAAGRYHRTLQPPLAVTLCELCMPEAFCGLETVRQKAPWTLCALWEKNLTSVRDRMCVCEIEHWTYSQKMSIVFSNHSTLHSVRRPSSSKNMLFFIREEAFLATRRACSAYKKGMFSNAIYNVLTLWGL